MTALEWADLEITLHRYGEGGYTADLRFEHPHRDGVEHLRHDEIPPLRFDFERLAELALNTQAYGAALSDMLFAGQIRQRFAQHRARLNGLPLRLRLAFGTDAARLQALHWETLQDPELGGPLLGRQMPFSRSVSAAPFREASRSYREPLRALIAIANPRGVEQFELTPINTGQQLACARQILESSERTELVEDQVTLERLTKELRRGCDLLYIAAHGGLAGEEYKLLLADKRGQAVVVRAADFLHRIRNLNELPRLVVLMSCQSAGAGTGVPQQGKPSLVALGPLIAEAGVPAVLAMHGKISIETATSFLQVFVEELRRSGVIDDAAAAARDSVQEREDAWMPVLYMRSKSGLIWQPPRPPGQRTPPRGIRREFDKWGALIANLQAGRCVPILGPGLLEPILGSTSQIAEQLATRHSLGLVSLARKSLPQVAQLLQLRTDRTILRSELSAVLRENLARHCPDAIPTDNQGMLLFTLLKDANRRLWRNQLDPHSVLAQFPCRLFVNAAPDPLLEVALQQRGKEPQLVICPWTSELSWATGAFDPSDRALDPDSGGLLLGQDKPQTNSAFLPEAMRPIIYHPFGILQLLWSLVLTEDDYFQYLVGNTIGQAQKLSALPYLLTNSALLFIGFRLDDWGFRVLLREILQLNSTLSNHITHIGVQIDPATSIATDDQSYSYLEEQLRAYNITIYWESTQTFIQQLDARTRELAHLSGGPP
jgi:hypothetical protein